MYYQIHTHTHIHRERERKKERFSFITYCPFHPESPPVLIKVVEPILILSLELVLHKLMNRDTRCQKSSSNDNNDNTNDNDDDDINRSRVVS